MEAKLDTMLATITSKFSDMDIKLNELRDEMKSNIDDVKVSVSKQVDSLQASVSELEVRISATESHAEDLMRLSRKVDALTELVTSSTLASFGSRPPPASAPSRVRQRSPTGLADFQDIPVNDANSDDLSQQPKMQRIDSPQLAPAPAAQPPPQRFRLPDPQRQITSESSVHFNTSVPKITKDLRSFLAFLFPQIFTTPLNIEDLKVRHISPKRDSDIEFVSKARAQCFITWVKDNPSVKDEYGNLIQIRASPTASPMEQAMGRILGESYRVLSNIPTFDYRAHNLHTNKKSGILLATFNGIAHTLLQVTLPHDRDPHAVPKAVAIDPLPVGFQGVTADQLKEAIDKANAKIATMQF